jgi:hypothetical protein
VMSRAKPPEREELPALPPGAVVTAWMAGVLGSRPLSPRAAILLLLHVSFLRWQEYATMLHAQVEDAPDGGPGKRGTPGVRGLIGHHTAMSGGQMYPTREDIRALVRLEADERDRAARLAMMAHDIGLTGEDW